MTRARYDCPPRASRVDEVDSDNRMLAIVEIITWDASTPHTATTIFIVFTNATRICQAPRGPWQKPCAPYYITLNRLSLCLSHMAPQSSRIPSSVGSAVGRGTRVGGTHIHAVEGDPVHREDLRRVEDYRRRRQGSDVKQFSWNLPFSEVNDCRICRSSDIYFTLRLPPPPAA